MAAVRHILTAGMATLLAAMSVRAEQRLTDTAPAIFHPSFHTLQTKVNGNDMLPPVIMLGSDDRLQISFDELSDSRRYMRYRLLHCDAWWRPDHLIDTEYLGGFNEGTVDDFAFSEATTVQYVNYRIELPSERMQPLLSGNYLVQVYDEETPDEPLLQSRFSVVEPAVTIIPQLTTRTDVDYNDAHQQLEIAVGTRGVDIRNPYTGVTVVVEQNGRRDNSVVLTSPARIAGDVLHYENMRQLIFEAGNEYRRMETVSELYPGMHVASIGFAEPYYHMTLQPDGPRNELPYAYDRTQNGRFRIRSYDAADSDVESDYVVTHFSLDMPEQAGCDVFIDGDLTLRRFDPGSLMVFNRATGRYEASLLLKQGSYNYQYLLVPHGGMRGYTGPIEGDKFQTVNEYIIKVYLRNPGERYDRLIGVTAVRAEG